MRSAHFRDSGKMLCKFGAIQLVSCGSEPQETTGMPISAADHVMIKNGNSFHFARFHALYFQRRYLVSQG